MKLILFLLTFLTTVRIPARAQTFVLDTLLIPNKYLTEQQFKLNTIKYNDGVFYFFDGKSKMLKYSVDDKIFDSIPLTGITDSYQNYQWEVRHDKFYFFNISRYTISVLSASGNLLYTFSFGLKYGRKKYIYFPGSDSRKNTFTVDENDNFYFPVLEEFYFNRKKLNTEIPLLGKMNTAGKFTAVFGQPVAAYFSNDLIRTFDPVAFSSDPYDSLIYLSQPLSDSIQVYDRNGNLQASFGIRGRYMQNGPENILPENPTGNDTINNKLKIENSYYAGIYTTKDFIVRMYYTAGPDSSASMFTPNVQAPIVQVRNKNKCETDPVRKLNQQKIIMERGCFLQVYSKSNRELIADSLVPLRFFWFHGSHGNLLYLTGNGGAATPGFIRIYTLDMECFKKL